MLLIANINSALPCSNSTPQWSKYSASVAFFCYEIKSKVLYKVKRSVFLLHTPYSIHQTRNVQYEIKESKKLTVKPIKRTQMDQFLYELILVSIPVLFFCLSISHSLSLSFHLSDLLQTGNHQQRWLFWIRYFMYLVPRKLACAAIVPRHHLVFFKKAHCMYIENDNDRLELKFAFAREAVKINGRAKYAWKYIGKN